MNASISVVCYKSKTLANGENPLLIQISKNGKRKYQSLGLAVNRNDWDFAKNKPKPKCPNGDFIQKIILDKITDLQKKILEYNADKKDYTVTNLLNGNKSAIKVKTVGEFYDQLITDYKSSNKVGNRLIYKGSYNSIKEFSKGRVNFLFNDIDLDWLIRYEKWLRLKGNKETTISLLFRTLRSAYNKAIENKCTKKTNYPFNDFKVSKFDTSTSKRAISKHEILLIKDVDLSKEIESVQFARVIFIFTYLCGGINFTDLANLRPENIHDNRLQYIRQKTGKKISLQLSPDANKIITQYQLYSDKCGYLFPILEEKVHLTALQKQNRIHKILGKIDKELKTIAGLCKIKANLTTYVARHSFATVLMKSGINVSLISEALGHSDLATTQIYLGSFENEQIDSALKNLL